MSNRLHRRDARGPALRSLHALHALGAPRAPHALRALGAPSAPPALHALGTPHAPPALPALLSPLTLLARSMRAARPAAPAFWTLLLLCIVVTAARGLETGAAAPYFQLPWLSEEEAPSSPELFGESPLTALVLWNRGCPRCAGLGLQCDTLAAEAGPLGVAVLGLLFGPDEPVALRQLLADRGVRTPHLWDESGATARDLGLGGRHFGALLVDREGRVVAAFDDEIAELTAPIVAAVRQWQAPGDRTAGGTSQADAGGSGPPAAAAAPEHAEDQTAPRLSVDARARLSTTEGARTGDRGLLGEPLEPGALFLGRVDLRVAWPLARGVTLVPWLRVSNEEEEALLEGAEQWSNRHGTLSLIARRGPFAGTLGAFPLRVAPLVLQRWDTEDAPSIAGAAGCACAGGVAGVRSRSLEVLAPEYTFEGLTALASGRWARLRSAVAVPRWESPASPLAPTRDRLAAHYRRVLSAAALDLGRAGSEDPATGLATPWGVRLARVALDDDRRTISTLEWERPFEERDEAAWSAWLALRPAPGILVDGERAWWSVRGTVAALRYPEGLIRAPLDREAGALRVGGAIRRALGWVSLAGRAHWIRTDPGFAPAYRALTYEPNREGWRFSVGAELRDPLGGPERAGLELFHRGMRETEDHVARREFPGSGRVRETVQSASVRYRPAPRWEAAAHYARSEFDDPRPLAPDERQRGVSLDLRWSGLGPVEPALRFDWVDLREGFGRSHRLTQASLWVRVIA